ncbi:DUF2147 domain-containing protein [Alloalcanivorax gelatiniphagus]|uniref:DUF2147 domain-containing protein n=1 Tax=Alloalcanivorax gelatiniphagus TaxID=1194167 RepID=A0ABY2XJB1_9GAMM|nr:DUF2147 domain-containing protein [Alloalcanivorax gelatiniphagus]TMW11996.1 DUF2147 domain-containing protein [Alloalcanivorax gelatiniphagus]|tara:strand:- start:2060 stop:2515 length:456 start_codon:yes stop_codon:yes gene_type:complete
MIKPLISAALLGVCAVGWAADDSHAIEGVWETKTGGYVQIYQDGDTWNGRVVGSSDGEARFDENNPDESKRGRRLLGVTVLQNLKYAGGETWEDGSIYSPDNGKTYSAKATLTDPDTLDARGYIGVSLLGRTQTWHRVGEDAPHLHKDLLE